MKYKNLNYLVFFLYLISSSVSYSIERPDVNNLIIHKEKKTVGNVQFFNSKKNKVSLDDYKQNLTIINFWATWCAPCKEEMPHLDKLVSKNKFKDIKIIPINIADESLEKSKEFFKELNISNLDIFNGSSLDLAKEFKLRGIPTTIFIDKEGYEFARIIGYIDFENKSFLNWLSNNL
tara:strand:- start:996 stop:1526 length:531 start_codon:yes stop_codon:yes gene_type:complete